MPKDFFKYIPSVLLLLPLSILPLVFYPALADSFELPKWFTLMVVLFLAIGLFILKTKHSHKVQLDFSLASGGFLLLFVGSALSALFSGNIPEGLLSPMGPLVWLVFFLITTLHPPRLLADQGKVAQAALIISTTLISLLAVISRLNGFQKLAVAYPVFSLKSFTPAGVAISSLALLIFVLIWLVLLAHSTYKSKQTISFQLLVGALCLIVVGSIALFTTILPDITSSRLGVQDNWKIMMGASSVPKQAIVGVGPQNYIAAFSLYRPVSLNNTSIWNSRSLNGTGLLFHFQTTIGVFGSLGLLLLVLHLFFQSKTPLYRLLTALLVFVCFTVPPSLSLLTVLFLLIYTTTTKSKLIHLNVSKYIIKSLPTVGIVLFLVSGVALYYSFTLLRADYAVYKAQAALNLQDGQTAYKQIVLATKLFPYSPNYRRSASLVQAAVGFSILNSIPQESSGSAQAIENRNQAATLLSQAINDAKAATVLGSQNVVNWENLGNIYLQLIGLADNAASWSVASYQKAVSLDSSNPVNRYRLGVAYANAGDVDRGIAQLITAIELRNAYPDPYLALAQIYAAGGQWQKSLNAIDITLKLIPEGEVKTQLTKDREVIASRLEQTKNQNSNLQLPPKQTTSSPPTPSPTAPPKLPLNLPVAATDSAVPSPPLPSRKPTIPSLPIQ